MEYCDLGGKKASDKLQKYLHLKEAQDLIPEFRSFSTAEQSFVAICLSVAQLQCMLRNDSKRVLSSAARSLRMCMHLGSHFVLITALLV